MESQFESSARWPASEQQLPNAGKKPPTRKLVIENRPGLLRIDYAELWEYRELLSAFVVRELKVRYKQTAIGVAWVLLQPLVTMLIFTVIFGQLAKMPSDNVWYPVFALTALLPWTYFCQAVTRSSGALVGNANLVSKGVLSPDSSSSLNDRGAVGRSCIVSRPAFRPAHLCWYSTNPENLHPTDIHFRCHADGHGSQRIHLGRQR